MLTIAEIKQQKDEKISELITKSKMFFAFSDKQWEENKTPLQEGEKYVSFGAGAYLPKSGVEIYLQGIKDINSWYKETVKNNKARRANILYELQNHEAFYTGTIEDTVDSLGEDYTPEEVRAVYQQERHKHED